MPVTTVTTITTTSGMDATVVIAIIVAIATFVIGYSQMKIASAKLKLDLYNKRFNVYATTLEFCQSAANEEQHTAAEMEEKYRKFIVVVSESQFLFDANDGVFGKLADIQKNVSFIKGNVEHKKQSNNRDKDTDLAMETSDIENRGKLEVNLKMLEKQLEKYIQFNTISGWKWRM